MPKPTCFILLAAAIICSPPDTVCAQPEELVEIPLEKAFVPPLGFDDNDNVQAVLTGYLPNSCYQLKAAVVERDGQGLPVRVRQMAERKTDGICAEAAALPPHLSAIVPFTTEVSIGDAATGRLPVGRYALAYSRRGRGEAARLFTVETALHPTVDSLQYATVSTAAVNAVARVDEPVTAALGVLLTSTCTELAETLAVRRVDDVTIVLPTLHVHDNLLCAFVLRDVSRDLDLGRYGRGTYLVHIRSKNGQAVNRVFTAGGDAPR